MTYEPESGVLFSCDAFGSFGSLGEHVFDDELTEEEREFYASEAERYYANIVSTFSAFVERGIKKLEGLTVNVIAPSHGVIWRDKPEEIVEHYLKLASYKNGPAEQEVTVIWSSMYGNTEALLASVLDGLASEGVTAHVHRVPQEHVSFVLASAWRSSGIIIGTPTYEYKMFPPMYAVLGHPRPQPCPEQKSLPVWFLRLVRWSSEAVRRVQQVAQMGLLGDGGVPGCAD